MLRMYSDRDSSCSSASDSSSARSSSGIRSVICAMQPGFGRVLLVLRQTLSPRWVEPFLVPACERRAHSYESQKWEPGRLPSSGSHYVDISVASSSAFGLRGASSGVGCGNKTVQATNSGSETARNRLICNCEACGRIASIEDGRGGLCVDCYGEVAG